MNIILKKLYQMDAKSNIIQRVIKQYIICITFLYTNQCNFVYDNILVIKLLLK